MGRRNRLPQENCMNKKNFLLFAAAFAAGIGIALIISAVVNSNIFSAADSDRESAVTAVFVGESSINDYSVKAGTGLGKARSELEDYIYRRTGEKCGSDKKAVEAGKVIDIQKDKSLTEGTPSIEIRDGRITLSGKTYEDCLLAVRIFANEYLGYAFAGQEREHLLDPSRESIYIPINSATVKNPWIKVREPIVCLWDTTKPRGVWHNTSANLKSELLSYSDDELYDYVRMMKAIGYNGLQVTDMCSSWAAYGGYEYVHQRIRFMADSAHSLGMSFTLWVWAAEFTGYGWVDDSVDYYDNNNYAQAYDNPKALECFDKYSSIYASLADCCDRVIAHYSDPGNLTNIDDISYFAKVLRDKFKEKNPEIDFGINCYNADLDPTALLNYLGTDITLYSGARKSEDESWVWFKNRVIPEGGRYGVWSWYLTEMEIDQLAQMNVNSHLIKQVYLLTQAEDGAGIPQYWCEMDSYHVLNIFSHYVSAGLLQDPSRDESELLMEAAVSIVGAEYAGSLYDILTLIEDARTGSSWDTYYWTGGNYILKSKDYNSEDISKRASKALKDIDEIIAAAPEVNTLPLPVSVTELLELIRPHICQIFEFATFRGELSNGEKLASQGASREDLQEYINSIYTPVSEYDAIIGLWGQPEARAQYELLEDFCLRYELEVPQDATFISFRKMRILDEMITMQKNSENRLSFALNSFQWGKAYGDAETERLTKQLADEGLLTYDENGMVYLTDWENYR